jgi:hypothetical protein
MKPQMQFWWRPSIGRRRLEPSWRPSSTEGMTEARRPARVYRPWGWYQTMDRGGRFRAKRILVKPKKLLLQKHHLRAEFWVVVRGIAEVTRDNEVLSLRENKVLEHIGKLSGGGRLVEHHHAIDDLIGACLVVRTEILRLGQGFKRPDNNAGRIGPEIEGLPTEKVCLWRGDLWNCEMTGAVSGPRTGRPLGDVMPSFARRCGRRKGRGDRRSPTRRRGSRFGGRGGGRPGSFQSRCRRATPTGRCRR